MSSYNRTVWQDSPETEITAERLNNMEEGIETANDGLYRPNLFINGNFKIWSSEEDIEIFGTNNEEAYTEICDKWYAKHYDLENNYYVTKTPQGIRLAGISESPCYIYQRLDEETFSALYGKTVTLSWSYTQSHGDANHVEYETVDKSEQIVVGDDLDVFTAMTRVGLTSGIDGCIIHYIKLEVGEIVTPCIPDSKDAIICNLEKRVTELNGKLNNTLTKASAYKGNIIFCPYGSNESYALLPLENAKNRVKSVHVNELTIPDVVTCYDSNVERSFNDFGILFKVSVTASRTAYLNMDIIWK